MELRHCSRCNKLVDEDGSDEPRGMTAGYYYVRFSWSEFANPGEVFICDECMWKDPRYIALYGVQTWIPCVAPSVKPQ